MRFVTAIDEPYFPGVVALANSFAANAGEGVSLACMVFGDDDLASRVSALGVEVIHNPEMVVNLPVSEFWPVPSPAMYARLIIPQLFTGPVAWIDADCVVLKPLGGLSGLNFSQPVAAVVTSTKTIGQQVGGNIDSNVHGMPALFAGLLVFNVDAWNAKDITGKCFAVMDSRSDLTFLYVVQSVLSYVLRGDFHELDYCWQEFANRGPYSNDCRILHYVGKLPWRDEMKNLDTWNQYA